MVKYSSIGKAVTEMVLTDWELECLLDDAVELPLSDSEIERKFK